jgi:outer membrane protein TolC
MSRTPLIAPRRTVVRATAASALALLALAGCTSLAPDYARPMLPVPATLKNGSEAPRWRRDRPHGLQDFCACAELVALALQNNRDLRGGAGHRRPAQHGVEQSNRLPWAHAAGTRTRTAVT